MPDWLSVDVKQTSKGIVVTPRFLCGKKKDILIKGGKFEGAWDEDKKAWFVDWNDVPDYIDSEIVKVLTERGLKPEFCSEIAWAGKGNNKTMHEFRSYVETLIKDNYVPLDSKLIFKSDPYVRENYSTHRLPYDIIEGPTPCFDKIAETLYSKVEREKWMWAIGSILAGDSPKIQKFFVFYGAPGKGKSTVINIIEMLFEGYYSVFRSDALANKTDQFSMSPFKNNPLVAIEHEGNLSRVTDNTKLNSIVSHEKMIINEKQKQPYEMRMRTMLFIATNEPVDITNIRSGLTRRLVDIFPTGNVLDEEEYYKCVEGLPFELSGIAYKCLQVYLNDKRKYSAYKPEKMMVATNDFYNFVLENTESFENEDYTLRKVAYERYKKYCEESGVRYPLKITEFGLELQNFFEEFYNEYRDENKVHRSFVYKGFKSNVFSQDKASEKQLKKLNKADIFDELPDWLRLERADPVTNKLNRALLKCKAQYATNGGEGGPRNKWDDSKTLFSDIMSTQTHFVIPPKNLICIDFDLKDDGSKSLELNLKAAANFPKTYAEVSKSGKGVHLHYIYDGDPDELSSLYNTDIEIKVFSGKASLRRRLSLANNEDIAHISSGLPLKEVKKKVLDDYRLQDEKHLRNAIKKALRKEVHANTRPSIDYIKMLLETAFESGLTYDVSDMRQSVMNFAASSTNQAEYCMSVVLDLPFCSEEVTTSDSGGPNDGYSDEPIAFFDCEVFPNLFIVCYLVDDGNPDHLDKKDVVRLINPSANDISDLTHKYRLIGFNNLDYDNHILYGRILGYSNEGIYKLSQAIINDQKDAGFRESKGISFTDVYDFSNTKQSLKKWEIELGINHQEFPLRWDESVPEDMWELAADYCSNDVVATKATFYYKDIRADWEARQVLSKLSGLDVNDRTNNHSARIVFGKNRNPQSSFNYPDLSKEFPGYEFNQFGIDKTRYNLGADGKPVATTGKSIFMGDDPSEGGYVYFETGIHYNVVLLDIASLHPSTIEVLQLFGPEYTARFSEIKNARVAIKHKDWNAARGYLDGMLVPFLEGVESLDADQQQALSDSLSYAFKIVINAIYGCTSAPFANPFKDPRNIDNVVAKRGALFMILLKHEVQKRGFTVAHVKTDSIKIPNATQEIIDFVMDFGKKYGYTFEHEATYTKMCLVNKSVYIAKYDEYGERTKGGRHANQWTATGAEFKHPYIFKTLFSHEPITFKDYCETKSASGGGALYLDYNEKLTEELERELYSLKEELDQAEKGKLDIRRAIKAKQEEIDSIHSLSFVGKCGLFTPVEPGVGGGYLLRVAGEKVQAVTGTKGYRWLESTAVKERHLEDRIDIGYFRTLIDNTRAHIGKYGDANEFIEDD